MNLYRIMFKVKPTSSHPKYGAVKFAYLYLLLFDYFSELAADRAEAILKQLPYEKLVKEAAVYNDTEVSGRVPLPWLTDLMMHAYAIGFGYHLHSWLVDDETIDEAQFINTPWPGQKENYES